MHTYVLAYLHACIFANMHTSTYFYLQTCRPAYIHTLIVAYMATYLSMESKFRNQKWEFGNLAPNPFRKIGSNQYLEMYFHFHFGKLVPINIWKWKSISNVAYINILPTNLIATSWAELGHTQKSTGRIFKGSNIYIP